MIDYVMRTHDFDVSHKVTVSYCMTIDIFLQACADYGWKRIFMDDEWLQLPSFFIKGFTGHILVLH